MNRREFLLGTAALPAVVVGAGAALHTRSLRDRLVDGAPYFTDADSWFLADDVPRAKYRIVAGPDYPDITDWRLVYGSAK